MFRRKNKETIALALILGIIFTIGLIGGTISLFYVPTDVVAEISEAFSLKENVTFVQLLKENIAFEMMWLLLLWLIGSSTVTFPFMGAIIALRGFIIGFSISFLHMGEFDKFKLFLYNILPQCITTLPVMSFYILACVIHDADKNYTDRYPGGYFIRGLIFMFVMLLFSVIETWLMIVLKKIC